MKEQKMAKCLTIAGSDPSGGAGIQADLKTFTALGCYGMSVITALTAQNTKGVISCHSIPPMFIGDQLISVIDDIMPDCIKIGMLFSKQNIELIANILDERLKIMQIPVILDPVMVAKSGHRLLQSDAVKSLKKNLIPLATIITPNIDEAEDLLRDEYHNSESFAPDEEMVERDVANYVMEGDDSIDLMADQYNIKSFDHERRNAQSYQAMLAHEILKLGSKNVLIKGGHMTGEYSNDLLLSMDNGQTIETWIKGSRINTKNVHGAGCTLSSAICAFIAHGFDLQEACKRAKEYVQDAIVSGAQMNIGEGNGPLNHIIRIKSQYSN